MSLIGGSLFVLVALIEFTALVHSTIITTREHCINIYVDPRNSNKATAFCPNTPDVNWYEDELLIDGKFALDEKSLATPKLVPGCRQLFSGLSSIDVAIINEYFFLVTIINEEEVPLTTPNNLLDAYIGSRNQECKDRTPLSVINPYNALKHGPPPLEYRGYLGQRQSDSSTGRSGAIAFSGIDAIHLNDVGPAYDQQPSDVGLENTVPLNFQEIPQHRRRGTSPYWNP